MQLGGHCDMTKEVIILCFGFAFIFLLIEKKCVIYQCLALKLLLLHDIIHMTGPYVRLIDISTRTVVREKHARKPF